MKLIRYVLVLSLLAVTFVGCGQKGPLYLPQGEEQQAPAIPADDEEDEDGT